MLDPTHTKTNTHSNNHTNRWRTWWRQPVLTVSTLCLYIEYIAMYTYESSEQGDLSFQQGDVVVVTRKEGDWWTGVVSGKTGVFPSNYVKPRDSNSEVCYTPSTGSLVISLAYSGVGWWYKPAQACHWATPARAPLLRPGLSAAQDDCGLRKYKQDGAFFPYARIIVSLARPFSSAGTALKQSVEIGAGCARLLVIGLS